MTHKCKFVKHRNKRRRRTMSYKCHECFLVLVVRKRTVHRVLTGKYKGPVTLKNAIVTRYEDVRDPGYAEYAWRELFGYEAVHSCDLKLFPNESLASSMTKTYPITRR